MTFSSELHIATPTLGVIDPRSLAIRTVAYCRSVIGQPAEPRVSRQIFSLAGHLLACWDPRLSARSGRANLLNVHSLSGVSLLADSVDAGWRLKLLAQAGNTVCNWDGRGTSQRIAYDSLQRPVEIGERSTGAVEQIVERFEYAKSDAQCAQSNQCGQLVRHDDPAGTQQVNAYTLTGGVISQTRHFLAALDSPDWPAAIAARDELLESGEGYSTHIAYNAAGQVLRQTDALKNLQQSAHTLDGRLKSVQILPAGALQAKKLVDAIRYNAWGQIESECAGNGVISAAHYDPENGQLLALESGIPGHPALQALAYRYDPAGNLLVLEDRTLSTRYFNNQRIDPVNHYHYDSLYQLIEASGWESSTAYHGPAASPDRAQPSNYRQHYQYDAGSNLVELRHVGAQSYTRTFQVAPESNRSLPLENSSIAYGIDSGFDANGNLAQLQPGQSLAWNLRNQPCLVNPVSREEAPDDSERYLYDAAGNRLRKVRHTQASSRTFLAEVRYLPGLELRSNSATGERLQVILCTTGRGSVHMLHWEQGLPADIDNNQMRYNLADHLGSATMELDEQGNLLSKEVYYPYGATAWWQDANASQGRYKVRRYSGKERDATGLYYYGQRYYAPFLQRWINPDPAGYADGLNLYCMVANNPLNFIDKKGTLKIPLDILLHDIFESENQFTDNIRFEELIWNPQLNRFTSTNIIYTRGMEIVENNTSEWRYNSFTPIAIFEDKSGKLRLFANTRHQHMGIQPGMGLPLFAGMITQKENNIAFTNDSGHYKPNIAPEDVQQWLGTLIPQGVSVQYKALNIANFKEPPRLESIKSPEEYTDFIETYQNDYKMYPQLITYLKNQGLWESIKETYPGHAIVKIEETTMAATAIRNSNSNRTSPAVTQLSTRMTTAQLNTGSSTAVNRPGFLRSLFTSCAGRN